MSLVPPTLRYAQTASQQVFQTDWFPRYNLEYVESQEGMTGAALRTYTQIQGVIGELNSQVRKIVYCMLHNEDSALNSAIRTMKEFGETLACDTPFKFAIQAYEAAYPINPINGKRHFVAIPRSAEKWLGDNIFYPLSSFRLIETSECLSNGLSLSLKVSTVMQRLVQANEELLNPETETTRFDYRVKTVISSQLNAYAVPAGGMVVFSQLVKELHGAIQNEEIEEATVEFADGSHVKVDLRGVTADDVLAALLGHEMTHVASRHSIVSIFINIIQTLLLNIGRIALLQYLRTRDEDLQKLENKHFSALTQTERATLESKEKFYSKLNDVFAWIQDNVLSLDRLLRSRKNEYEADVTGAYFAYLANYNSLGALYLQEFLSRKSGSLAFLHKHFEFLYTHPYAENRKRAIFAAIDQIDPYHLRGRLSEWHLKDNNLKYDAEYLSPAMTYARGVYDTMAPIDRHHVDLI